MRRAWYVEAREAKFMRAVNHRPSIPRVRSVVDGAAVPGVCSPMETNRPRQCRAVYASIKFAQKRQLSGRLTA